MSGVVSGGGGMVPSRWPWWLCALAGLVMIAAMIAMGNVPGQVACDGQGGNAMLQFEMVTSPQDLATLFGSEPCRSTLAAAMDAVNRIDMAMFIPAFTLLQIFAAIGLWRRSRGMAIAVIGAALVAGGCDMLEDGILMTKTFELVQSGTADGDAIPLLMALVRAKFALLAIAAILIGLMVRADGGWWRWTGVAMIAGGATGLIGLIVPAVVGAGIGLAWVLLLIVALARSWRPVAVA